MTLFHVPQVAIIITVDVISMLVVYVWIVKYSTDLDVVGVVVHPLYTLK